MWRVFRRPSHIEWIRRWKIYMNNLQFHFLFCFVATVESLLAEKIKTFSMSSRTWCGFHFLSLHTSSCPKALWLIFTQASVNAYPVSKSEPLQAAADHLSVIPLWENEGGLENSVKEPRWQPRRAISETTCGLVHSARRNKPKSLSARPEVLFLPLLKANKKNFFVDLNFVTKSFRAECPHIKLKYMYTT